MSRSGVSYAYTFGAMRVRGVFVYLLRLYSLYAALHSTPFSRCSNRLDCSLPLLLIRVDGGGMCKNALYARCPPVNTACDRTLFGHIIYCIFLICGIVYC